jgi:hypothetical protein
VVVVEVIVEGMMTVKVPEGDPDAIFLVAVRVNVETLVIVVEHIKLEGTGEEVDFVQVQETRHLQTDETN